MQVFVPLASGLAASAECLDRARAGNQCWRESKTLLDPDHWPHHPAHSLFAGHRGALAAYNLALIHHVYRQGWCRPATHEKWYDFWQAIAEAENYASHQLPSWWGDERVHSTHRAALLFKNPGWFGRFGWVEPPASPDQAGRFPYVWPSDLREAA